MKMNQEKNTNRKIKLVLQNNSKDKFVAEDQ